MSGREAEYVQQVFESNWIAPLGPMVDAFEQDFAAAVGVPYALALSSGTAALHLALQLLGVGNRVPEQSGADRVPEQSGVDRVPEQSGGGEVLVSTLTFAASAFPVMYLGGRPTFIDSEAQSWNMDPVLLSDTLARRARAGCLPKAVVLVHLYGQSADTDPILAACQHYSVPLIEDAAEALGATYKGRSPGSFGAVGVFSFNGNKIITSSGGGMLVSADRSLIDHARKLAQQSRDPAPHYEHSEIGYNYRMSNILAGVGRGQMESLTDRVAAKRRIFDFYRARMADLPGIAFMPEASWGRSTRWLTCITVDPSQFGADRETIRLALEAENIEARPVWKPMHLQPVFAGCEVVGGAVAERLFDQGLCLPSGTAMTESDLERIVDVIGRSRR